MNISFDCEKRKGKEFDLIQSSNDAKMIDFAEFFYHIQYNINNKPRLVFTVDNRIYRVLFFGGIE